MIVRVDKTIEVANKVTEKVVTNTRNHFSLNSL